MKKPEKIITKVHTGYGDYGFTKVGNKKILKTEIIVRYLSALDSCNSYTADLDLRRIRYLNMDDGKEVDIQPSFSDYSNYRKVVQDYLFILGALAHNPNNPTYVNKLNELYDMFKSEIEVLIKDLPPLTGFIRTNKYNAGLMQLRTEIRQAEILAVDVAGFISNNPWSMYLNLLSDFVFAVIWNRSYFSDNLELWEGVVSE
jgi:cob(I)alamin adenosyltransferase